MKVTIEIVTKSGLVVKKTWIQTSKSEYFEGQGSNY